MSRERRPPVEEARVEQAEGGGPRAPARGGDALPAVGAPAGDERFGIEELAERGGVSRRTVRYYVQRGLLPAPTGLGRGRHYTRAHLDQLVRIRELQERGVPLADIAARLVSAGGSAAGCVADSGAVAQGYLGTPPAAAAPAGPSQAAWTRVVLRDGLELHVRGRRLSEFQARALHAAITEVLGPGIEEDGA